MRRLQNTRCCCVPATCFRPPPCFVSLINAYFGCRRCENKFCIVSRSCCMCWALTFKWIILIRSSWGEKKNLASKGFKDVDICFRCCRFVRFFRVDTAKRDKEPRALVLSSEDDRFTEFGMLVSVWIQIFDVTGSNFIQIDFDYGKRDGQWLNFDNPWYSVQGIVSCSCMCKPGFETRAPNDFTKIFRANSHFFPTILHYFPTMYWPAHW